MTAEAEISSVPRTLEHWGEVEVLDTELFAHVSNF